MGACTFSNLEFTRGDARDAFQSANNEMRECNGHQDGYSGDIQTVDGFRMIHEYPRYRSKAYFKWLEDRLDNLNKRECECIEFKGAALKYLKEKNGYKGARGIRAFKFYGWGAE